MTNIDNAAKIIRLAMLARTFRSPELRALTAARALHTAGLLMPDDATTQTETVGPYFPEDEEMPDLPEGTDVTRIVGPWEATDD